MTTTKILQLILVLSIIVSCGTSKKVIIDERAEIRNDYSSADVPALIKDLTEFPYYRNLTEYLLFDSYDYKNTSYSELKEYSRLAAFDYKASVFFDSLLINRQESVLKMLSELSIEQVGTFYKANCQEHDYLSEHLTKAYFTDIESLGYLNLRSLYHSFYPSDISAQIESRYYFVRDSLLNKITPVINEYLQAESDILDDIENDLRIECNEYIVNGVTSIINGLMEKNDRGVIKKVFKRQIIDSYTFIEYAEELINRHLSPQFIQKTAYEKLDEYLETTMTFRGKIYENFLPHLQCSDYLISNTYKDIPCNWQIGRQDIQTINDIRVTGTALTVGTIALGFIPGVGPLVAVAADVADFAYGMTQDSQIRNAMEELTQTLYDDSVVSVDIYINNIMDALRNDMNNKNNGLMESIYEEF